MGRNNYSKQEHAPKFPPVLLLSKDNDANKKLGTEAASKSSKSRIRTQSGDKIAIIKQQELKQRRKKLSKASHLHKGHENEEVFIQTRSVPQNSFGKQLSNFQIPLQNSSNFPFNFGEQSNFRIPLLPEKPRGLRVKQIKSMELRSNHDVDYYPSNKNDTINTHLLMNGHPFLDNNDLIDPQFSVEFLLSQKNNGNNNAELQDDHFTLINQNNDQVDIDDGPTPPKIVLLPDNKTIPFPHHRQADIHIDLNNNDDGDNLIYMGSSRASDDDDDKMTKNNNAASNFIKVVRLKNPSVSSSANSAANLRTAAKTVSMFMAEKMDYISSSATKKKDGAYLVEKKTRPPRVLLSSSINATTLSFLKSRFYSGKKRGKKSDTFLESATAKSSSTQNVELSTVLDGAKLNKTRTDDEPEMKMKITMTSSTSVGVIAKVHAHVSHCPKVKSPAEIICDIHIRDSHGHPNPQLVS